MIFEPGLLLTISHFLKNVAYLFLGALFLMLSSKIFKTENSNYKTAFKILLWPVVVLVIYSIVIDLLAFYGALNSFPLIVTLILTLLNLFLIVWGIWLVKIKYSVSTGKAILISLLSLAMAIIPMIIVSWIMDYIIYIISVLLFGGNPNG